MKKLVLFTLIAFLTILFSVAGTGLAQEKRDFFKVGVVTSLSGELAFGGTVTKRGYDMWEDAVNAQGGIDIGGKKYKVKLVYADDQSTPATAAVGGERLITQEKVDFILGPYASGTTLALAPITEKYKMPHITGSAESPLIWLERNLNIPLEPSPRSASMQDRPSRPSPRMSHPNPKRSPSSASMTPSPNSLQRPQKIEAEKQGLKVVKYEIVPEGSDYTPSISAIKPLNPDIFAMGNHEKAAIEMMKIAKELKFNAKAYTQHYGMSTPDFRKGLGKDIEYVFGNSVWTEDMKIQGTVLFKTPKEFADAIRKKFNVDPDYTEAGCTAAGIAFQEALRAIKAAPPLTEAQKEALVGALEKLNIMTFYGQVKFATEGDFYHSNAGLQPVTLQYQGGKLVVVGPGKFKVVAPKYPAPPWDKR